jgi:hypothetical protein
VSGWRCDEGSSKCEEGWKGRTGAPISGAVWARCEGRVGAVCLVETDIGRAGGCGGGRGSVDVANLINVRGVLFFGQRVLWIVGRWYGL